MFTNPLAERDAQTIHLKDLQSNVLRVLVDFIYTGNPQITNENVQDLMAAGAMLDMPRLIGQCTDHMIGEVCVANCIDLYIFASHFGCKRLKDSVKQYISEHFTEVIKSGDKIVELDVENLEELMSDDDLSIEKEEVLFEVLVKWTSIDTSRRTSFARLFKHIRVALIEQGYIDTRLKENCFVKDDSDCQQILRRLVRFHNLSIKSNLSTSEEHLNLHLNTTPRQGMFNRLMLVFSEGSNCRNNRALMAFDPNNFKNYLGVQPHPTFDLEFKIDYYQLATVFNNKLFFLGGVFYQDYHMGNNGQAVSDVYQYDIKATRWELKASMLTPRCCFTVTVLGKRIYVIGGKPQYPLGSPTENVEVYDSDLEFWSGLSPMPVSIYAHAAAVTSESDAIYVFGGKDEDEEFLDTVFRYDIKYDSWSLVTTQMPRPCGFCSAFEYQSKFYVFGGTAYRENILLMSIYDPVLNRWRFGEEFPEQRKITAASFHNGNIFVSGGIRHLGVSSRRSREVETRDLFKYDIEADRWSKIVKLVQYGNRQSTAFCTLNSKYLIESDFISTL